MVILTDQCVHADVISCLKESGIKTISAAEAKLSMAADSAIFAYAGENNCILLTFDHDFGNIIRFDISNSPGVVIIYIEDLAKEEILKNALKVFKNFKEAQFKGRLFIVEKDKIRIWPK